MIINSLVPLRANGQPARRRQFIAASFKAISRRRNCSALQGRGLTSNVTNATMIARQSPIAFQLLLSFHSCTLLRRVAHGWGRSSRAS